MESAKELINKLNITDECTSIEAKKGSSISRSVMETVCSFSNEPGLGGGIILLGVERDEVSMLFPYYKATGVLNPDKLTLDLASQCASLFNIPVRPEVEPEEMGNGNLVLKIYVPELPGAQKPLYFNSDGLPKGAYRRIGSSDQRCTDDDMHVFYNSEDTLDSSIVNDSSLEDISEEAVELYKTLRSKVNPFAEELTYDTRELLQSLGGIKKSGNSWMLTYTGLLVFGKRSALRRLLPIVRVDYIRVPGNEWVSNPDSRFTTVDMRGPLLELVQRSFSAIADDLPKGFLLPEGQMQAETIGLPSKVLREALVNAFIHRTYRENQPIQIIRYGNRIEIKNPGFSLKLEEQLGEPGSRNRNPFIAAIFHETNLAETKGSGIRTMRNLMAQARMAPPTFESDHSGNSFTARLLLHHFLSEQDIKWLSNFEANNLNDSQKRGLVFVREIGAIDNSSYRQINGCDVLTASGDLRDLRDFGLLKQKGKGRSTYYLPGSEVLNSLIETSAPVSSVSAPALNPSALVEDVSAPLDEALLNQLPSELKIRVQGLPQRISDPAVVGSLVVDLCRWRSLSASELAGLLQRSEKYVLRNFISPLREAGSIKYVYPEMPTHPDQKYLANEEFSGNFY